jgi:hypothetical protein
MFDIPLVLLHFSGSILRTVNKVLKSFFELAAEQFSLSLTRERKSGSAPHLPQLPDPAGNNSHPFIYLFMTHFQS